MEAVWPSAKSDNGLTTRVVFEVLLAGEVSTSKKLAPFVLGNVPVAVVTPVMFIVATPLLASVPKENMTMPGTLKGSYVPWLEPAER